jgi:catechol 2,3-dioxygenase
VLHLGSPDPERLARFYADTMSMMLTQAGDQFYCHGPDRRLIFSAAAKGSLLSAGYSVANETVLAGLCLRLEHADVAFEKVQAPFFAPGAISFKDLDGNELIVGQPAPVGQASAGLRGRLQHVVVSSRDALGLVRFYRDVIGLRESDRVLDDQGDLRTCFLRSDQEHHSFAVFQGAQCRLDHHCYEAVDWSLIRDWGDRLAAQQIPVKWGPGRHGPGNNLFLFFHDPDGNWVEISAELEIVTDRDVGTWPHEERTLNQWGQAYLRS